MARTKICDRCGKIYQKNQYKTITPRNREAFPTGLSINYSNRDWLRFDICDECHADFLKWMDISEESAMAKPYYVEPNETMGDEDD